MTVAVGRLQFLRGDFRGRRLPVRPPWALSEAAFVDACTRCGDCARACPEGIVVDGSGGYPEIRFARGECTFCGDCATACPTAALSDPDGRAPWDLRAAIDDSCLSRKGITCQVCGDHCPEGAIRFRPALGGVATPAIDADACTGCGACVAPCPVDAVTVRKETVA